MNRLRTTIALSLLFVLVAICHSSDFTPSTVVPGKTTGYFLGDVIEQRVALSQNGTVKTIEQLPALQREGPWLERVSTLITNDSAWLVVRYQIVNSPNDVVLASLPALNLAAKRGETVSVDNWYFSISPALPPDGTDNEALPIMQPDTQPQATETEPINQRLKFSSLLLALTLGTWLLWWLLQNRSDYRNLPYARAFKKIRQLDTASVDMQADAWVALHHAFNQTAGRTVSSGTLAHCFQAAPWLQSLENPINDFFNASTQRFFDTDHSEISFDLSAFSKMLYHAEKRYYSGIKIQRRMTCRR